MTTKKLTQIALMTAIISVLSPLSIPLAGEVPVSLATFAVMLAGVLLGPKDGTICAALYLLLGAIGIPVFAGYASGVSVLFGVRGGFLFGYVILAFFSGLFVRKEEKNVKKKVVQMIVGMIIGNAVLYALGIIWFMFVTKMGIMASLAACVIPFLPGDTLKIVAVFLLSPRLSKVIDKSFAK